MAGDPGLLQGWGKSFAVGDELSEKPFVFLPAGLRSMFTQVVIFSVEGNDRLAGAFVKSVRRQVPFRHFLGSFREKVK